MKYLVKFQRFRGSTSVFGWFLWIRSDVTGANATYCGRPTPQRFRQLLIPSWKSFQLRVAGPSQTLLCLTFCQRTAAIVSWEFMTCIDASVIRRCEAIIWRRATGCRKRSYRAKCGRCALAKLPWSNKNSNTFSIPTASSSSHWNFDKASITEVSTPPLEDLFGHIFWTSTHRI